MGLNLSELQIAQELGIDPDDAQAMVQRLRQGIVERGPVSSRARSSATKSMSWPGIRAIPRPSKKRAARPAAPAEGGAGPGDLVKEKPPIFGMIQRGGEVVIRMLADVKQVTIGPLIKRTIAPGA